MYTSSFQFTKPVLVSLEMKADEKKMADIIKSSELNPVLRIEIGRHTKEPMARVTLHVAIGVGEDETSPYMLKAAMAAAFKWNDEMTDDAIDAMLSQNAVALLISYIRPVISSVTSETQFPPYDLPFIDVTSIKDKSV